ncbi:SRPBCC family protein [Methylovirgula sp. 4M-Z18]|uniref:SRPBCC family protein n=1 Tax=Methylovirgula sp. 4M-Z18 TaxID=2293567 RepID=UPI000E2ED11E|nr:SRPBCC family protein [Methylovirgula sp. 4M-Z18]RFB74988.1 polyketide cyclase [Methylovirgula sp. 4M-Z18]
MLEAKTLSISIPRPWQDLYEAIWRPEFFPKWASGLSSSALTWDGEQWRAQGPEGPIRIRFSAHNPYGIMDHTVDTGMGEPVYVPMRVLANGDGAEVMLTIFCQPAMTAEKFEADLQWVEGDLQALKALTIAG